MAVIDFGTGLGHQLSDLTRMTNVGTQEYLSPQQADLLRHDINTRSVVCSAGVVSYAIGLPRSSSVDSFATVSLLKAAIFSCPPPPAAN